MSFQTLQSNDPLWGGQRYKGEKENCCTTLTCHGLCQYSIGLLLMIYNPSRGYLSSKETSSSEHNATWPPELTM